MPGTHAILSPSASSRWMKCPVSARLESEMPSKDTAFSKEGTIAHKVAEGLLLWCLSNEFEVSPAFSEILKQAHDLDSKLNVYTFEAAEDATREGLDFDEILETVWFGYAQDVFEHYLCGRVVDPTAELKVEVKLDLTDFIPEGFGTSDAIVICGDTMTVYDLKYGKGVEVDAVKNTQMMIYAIGAYFSIAELWSIKNIEMCIIQPRLHHESHYLIDSLSLIEWANRILKPAAIRAYNGEGEPFPGDHCRFCRCQGRCHALADFAQAVVSTSEPSLMEPEQIADILSRADVIKAWLKAVEESALATALNGGHIPGFKVVEGRSLRKITDQGKAVAALVELGWEEEQCYKPREIRTISELEKMVGKKQFSQVLGAYVEKPQGKPALVPESDPRVEFSPSAIDFID